MDDICRNRYTSVAVVVVIALILTTIVASEVMTQLGATANAFAKVIVHDVTTPEPMVTFPAKSEPSILGSVPQDETVGVSGCSAPKQNEDTRIKTAKSLMMSAHRKMGSSGRFHLPLS